MVESMLPQLLSIGLVGPLFGCVGWYFISAIEVLLLLSLSLWFYKGKFWLFMCCDSLLPIVNNCVDKKSLNLGQPIESWTTETISQD